MPKYDDHFRSPAFIEETIVDGKNAVIGTIRIKPSGVLWKAAHEKKYYQVKLEVFRDWIAGSESNARRVKQ